jgi:hypothetical protein
MCFVFHLIRNFSKEFGNSVGTYTSKAKIQIENLEKNGIQVRIDWIS